MTKQTDELIEQIADEQFSVLCNLTCTSSADKMNNVLRVIIKNTVNAIHNHDKQGNEGLVEIIPDDLPDWMIKAMAECQLFNTSLLNEKEQREKLASIMVYHGLATGHGDTIEDLIDNLDSELASIRNDKQGWVSVERRGDDGNLAECPLCKSLDIGGAHDTVNCYGCGLQITKPRPLQNAIDAWNMREGQPLPPPPEE